MSQMKRTPAFEAQDPIVHDPGTALEELATALTEIQSLYGMVYERIIDDIIPDPAVAGALAASISQIWNVLAVGNASLDAATRLTYTILEALPDNLASNEVAS